MKRSTFSLGVLGCAASWLFIGPIATAAGSAPGWALLAIGVVLITVAAPGDAGEVAARRVPRWASAPAGLAAAGAILLAWRFFPEPYAAILIGSIAVGSAVALSAARGRGVRSLSVRLMPAAFVLMVQAVFSVPLWFFAVEHRVLPGFGWLAAGILRPFGVTIPGASDGAFFIFQDGSLFKFVPTSDKVALVFFVQFVAAVWLVSAMFPRMARPRMLPILAVTVLYMAVRLAVIAMVSIVGHGGMVFNNQVVPLLLSLALYPFIVNAFVRTGGPEGRPSVRVGGGGWRVVSLAVAVLAFSWLLVGFDPGVRKEGRVLIDNSHGDWENTEVPFDRDYFGTHSGYAYSEMKRILSDYYDVTTLNAGRIQADTLERVDVLVLKTPIEPYAAEETAAIIEFVRRGGGVVMLGDHTNFLGMNTYLNQVALAAGIQYRSDQAFRVGDAQYSYRSPSFPWRHPVTMGLEGFGTMTGCTFATPGFAADTVLWHERLHSEAADYSHGSFFGPAFVDGSDPFGPERLAAAAPLGAGRVVALGDSTIFSSFTMHDPGRRELILGATEYAMRENSLPGWHRMAAALAAILALLGWIVLVGRDVDPVRRSLEPLLLVPTILALAVPAIGLWKQSSYRPLVPIRESPVANVMVAQGPYTARRHPYVYGSAFVALARSSYVPRYVRSVTEALDDAALLVLFEPDEAMDTESIGRIKRYVTNGGKLLVVDAPENRGLWTPKVLSQFDFGYYLALVGHPGRIPEKVEPFRRGIGALVALDVAEFWAGRDRYEPGPASFSARLPVAAVAGGIPLLHMGEAPVAAYADVGKGRVVATTLGAAFSNMSLGELMWSEQPAAERREQYDLFFDLIDLLRLAGEGRSSLTATREEKAQ